MGKKADDLAPVVEAAKGLLYPSESDAPLDAVRWKAGGTLDQAVAVVAKGRAVRETSLQEFFAELEASDEGPQWTALRQAVERQLTGGRVFRVGERSVDVYVVGKSRSGDWAGLHTTSVET